jgi:hemoglobin
MGQSLYERLGGQAAVMAAVDLFYQKVLADDLTRPFFESLDMAAQTKKQIAFMTWAFGGPSEYRGRDLTTAHASLVKNKGLGDQHFDAVAKHLDATLRELGVSQDLIQEALGIVGSTRDKVLGRAN